MTPSVVILRFGLYDLSLVVGECAHNITKREGKLQSLVHHSGTDWDTYTVTMQIGTCVLPL